MCMFGRGGVGAKMVETVITATAMIAVTWRSSGNSSRPLISGYQAFVQTLSMIRGYYQLCQDLVHELQWRPCSSQWPATLQKRERDCNCKKTWNFSTDVVQESESEMTEKGTPGNVWIIEKDIFELGVKNTEKTVKETLGNDWISGGGRGSGGVHWSLGQNSKTKRCRHHRGVPLVMGIFKTNY